MPAGDKEFWAKQKELVVEMQDKSTRSYREEQREKFAERRLGLVGDTAYFAFFIFCGKLDWLNLRMVRESINFAHFLRVFQHSGPSSTIRSWRYHTLSERPWEWLTHMV
jgi:hypothetical protein